MAQDMDFSKMSCPHWYRLVHKLLMCVTCLGLLGMAPPGVESRDACRGLCSCKANRTVVSCRDAGLTSIPHKLPHNIRELDLDGNRIASLEANIFANATSLRKLYIRHNNLSYINANAFANLTNLKVLALDDNWIQNLPANAFAPCTSLRELYLADNYLGLRVLNISMTSLPKLHILDISRNDLDGPQLPWSFSTLGHLKELSMKGVYFRNMTEDYFLPLDGIHLTKLDLARSHIAYVADSTFSKLQRLNVLDLSRANRPITVLKNIFAGLQNSSIEKVLLQRTMFEGGNDSRVPSDLFHGLHSTKIRVLHLEGNYVGFNREIPGNLFRPLRSLRELYLDYCDLVDLPLMAFHGLRHLQELSLRQNMLTCTQSSHCEGIMGGARLPNLDKLDLSDNAISTATGLVRFDGDFYSGIHYLCLRNNSIEAVTRGLFVKLTYLQYLDLSFNPIHTIESRSFQYLHSLQTLVITHCSSLTALQNDTMRGLRSLTSLHLHNNGLVSVEKEALLGPTKLTEINLRRNSLGGPSFSRVRLDSTHIVKLDLGDNHISEVPRGLLANRANLTHIRLDYNRISECSGLDNLPRLELLNLSFNSLVSPSITCFQRLGGKRRPTLNLAGNPFYCDCHTLEFATWLNQSGIIIERETVHQCSGPREALGKDLFQYHISQWDCHRKFIVVPILTALFAALGVLIIGGAFLALKRGSCASDFRPENEGHSDSSSSCNGCSSSCVLTLDDMHAQVKHRRKKPRKGKSQAANPSIVSEECLIKNDDLDGDLDGDQTEDTMHDDDIIGSLDSELEDEGVTEVEKIMVDMNHSRHRDELPIIHIEDIRKRTDCHHRDSNV